MDQLSRFIDGGVRKKMERIALGQDDKPKVPDGGAGTQLLDLRALLRGRFGA
jgi:hypothetical protein